MMTPQHILDLLKKNELPEYAQEKRSFFDKLVGKKEKVNLDLAYETFRKNTYEHKSGKLIEEIIKLLKSEKSLFNLSHSEYDTYQTEYKNLIKENSHLKLTALAYKDANQLKGLDYQFVRYLLFFAAFQPDNYNRRNYANLLTQFPDEYLPELAIILLFSVAKTNNLKTVFADFDNYKSTKNYPIVGDFIQQNKKWFYQFMISESKMGWKPETEKAVEVLIAAKKEIEEKNDALDWNQFGNLVVEEMDFFDKLNSLENDALIEFCKLNFLHSRHNLHKKLNGKPFDTLLAKINWNESQVIDFVNFAMISKQYIKLPKEVLKAAKQFLEKDSKNVLEVLWKYFTEAKSEFNEDKKVGKLLQDFAHLRELVESEMATAVQIFFSGMSPISPKHTQNVYKGMRPEQVRPFFQLLREVGDVDIIKFYQDREKNHFVRFQINGNQYDLKTTNGLGVNIIQPLNTLIYEEGIPYQFVYFNKGGENTRIDSNYVNNMMVRVTLVNEVCYDEFGSYFMNSPITGFAKYDKPIPAFLKRIEELKAFNLRADLDKIDLTADPKFNIIRAELEKLKNLPVWTELLVQAVRFPLDKNPNKTWQKETETIVRKLGKEAFQSGQVMILEKLTASDEWFQDTEKLCALRGLTWMSRLHPGSGQLYLLQKIANKAYKKVSGGPLSAKLGNMALETLAKVGNLDAFGVFTNLEAKAKYPVYKRAIASRKKKFTALLKEYSPDDLADRAVPTHGILEGKKSIEVGDCKATLTLDGLKVITTWETAAGKVQKSVPSHLKPNFVAEIKSVKAEAKSIAETFNAQTKRLEKSWLKQRTWKFENWQPFLQNHELMKSLTKRLIWQAETTEKTISFLAKDGQTIDSQGNKIEIPADSTIRLWHPALASVADTFEWRDLLFQEKIRQPFKQAFREVYFLTPAEETTYDFSNRFSGHYLRGNTLYSLGKNREWKMSYEEAPQLHLPDGELVAFLNINGRVLYSECTTMDLHFMRKDKHKKGGFSYWNQPKVPLNEIPPVIISEVMRDVDLFVAVAGMGVDPYFDQSTTGELMNYWQDTSFGKKSNTPMAEIRKDLLKRLLPMTKIAKKASFVNNFLRVEGKIRNYKINLGSGNILMEPNDQYLCIVPNRNTRMEKKIWLPFEGGDQTLMMILSKAFLLVEDDKITDPTILRQINRK